ncbi:MULTISPECIES: hypothetical protein [Kitasatospora]|uniref:Uncharacterized protein n=1 Tax=Kitasatospora setae (strain ATCC 33774 / DSM 43861 / JCM 3304 / KCC A-0304 / NBRC 14216 / KM-6054) TaxID=452652 RepID=E4NG65_KITSK|nr:MULTISPECIES: hypothetical protein [Kitasatospora]BAJ30495.1 hypothetical protein KSE_47150 [Kitasatospora setae KM-6054]
MTSLHLGTEDFQGVVFTHDGRVRLDLTDGGLDRLAGVVRQFELAKREPEQRAMWLRNISDVELVELATGRWGGPEQDVLDEAVRHLQAMAEKLHPALGAVRAAGLIDQAAGEQPADGSTETAGSGE